MDLDEGLEADEEQLQFEDDTCALKGVMEDLISKPTK